MLNGSLFTRDFLNEGIRDTDAWMTLNELTVAVVRARLAALFATFGKLKNPTEAETEKELIWPLLEAIGWADMSVQQNLSVKARDDVPDALLFADTNAKANAAPLHPGSGSNTASASSRRSAGAVYLTARQRAARARRAYHRRRCFAISVASMT